MLHVDSEVWLFQGRLTKTQYVTLSEAKALQRLRDSHCTGVPRKCQSRRTRSMRATKPDLGITMDSEVRAIAFEEISTTLPAPPQAKAPAQIMEALRVDDFSPTGAFMP